MIEHTITATREELIAELERVKAERDELLVMYGHTHEACYITVGDKDILTDKCNECGLDIRHAIHSGAK